MRRDLNEVMEQVFQVLGKTRNGRGNGRDRGPRELGVGGERGQNETRWNFGVIRT